MSACMSCLYVYFVRVHYVLTAHYPVNPFSVYLSVSRRVSVTLFVFIRSPYSFAICWRIELPAHRPAHSQCLIHSISCPLSLCWLKSVFTAGRNGSYGLRSWCMGHDECALRKGISLDFLNFEAALLTEGVGVFCGAMLRYCVWSSIGLF